jgi:hypothetical protein
MKMKAIVNLLSVIAFFLAAAGSVQADEPILLRYKMSKGVKTQYRTTTQVKQKQTIMGNDMVTEMNGRSIDERGLVNVDEKGNFVVRTENKRFYSKFVNGQSGEYVYDSTNDERDTSSVLGGALTPLYDRLNGAVVSFTFSPRGEVTAVKGYKSLLADILKDKPLAAQFFSEGESDEAFKIQQNNSIVTLPKKPVKVGDTWVEPYVLNLKKLGKFTGKKTFTYEGPGKVGDRETIKISITTELTADLDIDTDGAKVAGTISVLESSGTAHFDPHKGQLVSLNSAMTLTGTLNVAVGGQNITIPMEQKLSATVELLDDVSKARLLLTK